MTTESPSLFRGNQDRAFHEVGASPKRRAAWDIVNGLRRHEIWTRQSVNEVRRRYRRTVLGPTWVTLSLIIFAIVMSFVWAGLFQQEVTKLLPFLLSGLIPWGLMAGIIGEGTGAFLTGEALIKSRQFPYTILTNIVLTRNFIIFLHNLVGYVLVAAVCGVSVPLANLLLLFPGLVLVMLNCGWMCLLVAIFCLRYRDFQQLVSSLLTIAVFVTPVFFQASQLQGKRTIIIHANPMHHMVDIIRQPLLGNLASSTSYIFCIVTAVVGWYCVFWLFASKRDRLAYWF
jgi:ABC-type polysaccharide/polyol phosphate export permease